MGTSKQQLAEIAAAYLTALRSGDRVSALLLAREALSAGIHLCELYRDLLQPALYEIGRLWERGELDVAGEHLATAITRSVMELCVNKERPLPAGPPSVLATCVGPELHDVGLRMVADCLEISGWHTLYLGCNMPLEDIVALAVRERVAVVVVSITMGSHAPAVRDLARALRQSEIGATVKLLVGGQPFNRTPGLWRKVGADGTAPDAMGAVEWVRSNVHQERSDDSHSGSLGARAHEA